LTQYPITNPIVTKLDVICKVCNAIFIRTLVKIFQSSPHVERRDVEKESCHEHKESQEQKLKERSKFNFQIRNKTKLCDSKIKTQNLQIKT
jgi:2-oxo-4-hydroxy-4-carboxy--5-ureidoimidazoline (OHCU) decarboxylase